MRPKWQVWAAQFDDRNFAPFGLTLVKSDFIRTRVHSMRAPVRLADLQTRAEALSYLRSTFERQLEAAIDANAEPNKVIAGDYSARQAFNALLSPVEQRAFFQ